METINEIRFNVDLAFRKLKSYVYHENFSLDLRLKIAEFETNNLDQNLENLSQRLFLLKQGRADITDYLNSISCQIFPKKFKNPEINERESFFSNRNKKESYIIDNVKKITPFIDCSIELHIISILWIMDVGKNLDSKINKCCYANRLVKNEDDEYYNNQIQLFSRYYINYNSWRDDAVKQAKKLHRSKMDVALLNLDIENYYNSVDFNVLKIPNYKNNWLNILLSKIHKAYKIILEKKGIISGKKNVLPIGLISSNILSNYYLDELDSAIIKRIRPSFYGRYVDDILIVTANPSIDETVSNPVSKFIKEYLCSIQLWKNENSVKIIEKDEKFTIFINKNDLNFQITKVKLFYFNKNESINVLDNFENELIKNTSEFKFLPESSEVLSSFESSSFNITYSDSINKIRSIESFDPNKYGASKHLSKLITTTKFSDKIEKKEIKNIDDKLIDYFSGQRTLELNGLWEKVFTFYVINKAEGHLIRFSKSLIEAIASIHFSDINIERTQSEEIRNLLFDTLIKHLSNCYAMAASLDNKFFNENILRNVAEIKLKGIITTFLEKITLPQIERKSNAIVFSNLLRHYWCYYPLLNYCNQVNNFSFICYEISHETNFTPDQHKIKYSPRFIHYHEVVFFNFLCKWFTNNSNVADELHDMAFNDFLRFNNVKDDNRYKYLIPKFQQNETKTIKNVIFKKEKDLSFLTVGIVNMKVNYSNSLKSLLGKPNITVQRISELNEILNQSIKFNCDLIVFPELSIPFQLITYLSEFSRKNQIGIIFGAEYVVNRKNEALNNSAVILPMNESKLNSTFVDCRLKSDYSPFEKENLSGRFFNIPKSEDTFQKVYIWRNIAFSVFNCYELTDIEKRNILKGEVDLCFAIELNKDTNYFSSIIESASRDIHAYFIQVNSSNYGDSRITLPAKTEERDTIRIKGSENITLLVGKVNIKELREFQSFDYNLQKNHDKLKPTPPNYKKSIFRIE